MAVMAAKRLVWAALWLVTVGTSTRAWAGFDWGSDCSSGQGEFSQVLVQGAQVTIGEVPKGKRQVRIELSSDKDLDIQLFDRATEAAIVAWPYGMLSGPSVQQCSYQGVAYRYSGYNGAQGARGHEYIEILGDTNRPLVMKAFAYAAGTAKVTYAWQAVPTCGEKGEGSFFQWLPQKDTAVVGTIPIGKSNVRVELWADNRSDIDLQLVDAELGRVLVAWPNGDLASAGPSDLAYRGVTIHYSGYNGIGGERGHEDLSVWGTTPFPLEVRAYGYAAGYAAVSYAWGIGAGVACGGALPPCAPSLTCKGAAAAPGAAGECHTGAWCLNDALAQSHCQSAPQTEPQGVWICQEFACVFEPAL
jgi:hypothetical protein